MIYLDNAATSYPKPPSVIDAVSNALAYCGNPGRSAHSLAMFSAEQIFSCRQIISSYFHYLYPEHIIFTLNATYAINIAIHALYEEGCHVLISDLEHNAVYRPISQLAREGRITFDIVSHKGDFLQNIKCAITPRTKMMVCTQASNVTGEALPIKEIGAFCYAHNVKLIIDASQSAGHLPVHLDETKFDAFCAPAHKGLYGIQGAGFLILNNQNILRDFISGGTGSDPFSDHMPLYLPERFEAGTPATPAIAGLAEGIRFLEDTKDNQKHLSVMTAWMHDEFSLLPLVRLHSSKDNPCGILSFSCDRLQGQLMDAYHMQDICVRDGFHCAPLAHKCIGTDKIGCIRASIGAHTKQDDIEKFISFTRKWLLANG